MSVVVTLPDGQQKEFSQAVSILEIAENIGARLAKATIAAMVNDVLVDTSFQLKHDAHVRMITARDELATDILRHSCAHLLAHAVKQLFPDTQVTIGPVIENGFYYDFAFSRAFTTVDLEIIEKRMHELAEANIPIHRKELSREQAIQLFKKLGELYKVEIIEGIPGNETLSVYEQGDFIDLCRGPHVPNTGFLKIFKLTKVAGAYWRGDSNAAVLQRIYGTAFAEEKQLKEYLFKLEEAEKRDHRRLAKIMNLFHIQEESAGMVFWHPAGHALNQTVRQYISKTLQEDGYTEVVTPQLVDLSLWQKSGHWDMFSENMFTVEAEKRMYALKPMSCPCHVLLFKQALRSYRDLPIRYAEFGCVHRNEASGTMHGLMRVKQLTQDDGHIFCSEKHLQSEASRFIRTLKKVYRDFGFNKIKVRLATRPEKRLGEDTVWDRAESALENALTEANFSFELAKGEGAFYGPKIEFHLEDCLGRMWQCGTLQLDYALPQRLDAHYITEDGSKQRPVILHRALLGSIERFLGILLEHYAGKLPFWLAPEQIVVMNITDKHADYVQSVAEKLLKSGLRAKVDLRNEKIGFKIREHALSNIPYLLIAGDRECQTDTIAVRTQDGKDLGIFSLMDFTEQAKDSLERYGEKRFPIENAKENAAS